MLNYSGCNSHVKPVTGTKPIKSLKSVVDIKPTESVESTIGTKPVIGPAEPVKPAIGTTAVLGPQISFTGRELSRLVKEASTAKRALLAHDLEQGRVQVVDLTRAQSAALAKISLSYANTAARLTQDERLRLVCGVVSLAELHRNRRTNADIVDLVLEIGPDGVMDALDALTVPSKPNDTVAFPDSTEIFTDESADSDEPADWWKELERVE